MSSSSSSSPQTNDDVASEQVRKLSEAVSSLSQQLDQQKKAHSEEMAAMQQQLQKHQGANNSGFRTILDHCDNSPLFALAKLGRDNSNNNMVLVKHEGSLPTSSVKVRAALGMLKGALARGELSPGGHVLDATSGNTGLAIAAVCAALGLKATLVQPDNATIERTKTMRAYGAKVISVSSAGGAGMERARDLVAKMQAESPGQFYVPNQFDNDDNFLAHYRHTGPEIWAQTHGRVTHFVSAKGTTGTVTGVSKFLKEREPSIKTIGCEPTPGSAIPGIRKWPEEYQPKIWSRTGHNYVDELWPVSQADAEDVTRRLAREEGIFVGPSSGGAVSVALKLAASPEVHNAVIVAVCADLGSLYLSSKTVFPEEEKEED